MAGDGFKLRNVKEVLYGALRRYASHIPAVFSGKLDHLSYTLRRACTANEKMQYTPSTHASTPDRVAIIRTALLRLPLVLFRSARINP